MGFISGETRRRRQLDFGHCSILHHFHRHHSSWWVSSPHASVACAKDEPAGLLGFATEEAALRMGETLGGLLNATLGNAVELIVAILALIKVYFPSECFLCTGLIERSVSLPSCSPRLSGRFSQIFSSFSACTLSLDVIVWDLTSSRCFFAGGLRFAEQTIKTTAAQLNSSLLLIAVIAVLIPSAFHFSITTSSNGEGLSLTDAQEGHDLLAMSHGVAVILLVLYLGYLLFQMWTHAVSRLIISQSCAQ